MKTKRVVWVLLWASVPLSLTAQVQFTPEKPQLGQTVTFVYTPKGTPLENEPDVTCQAMYYGAPSFARTARARPIALIYRGDTWTGSLPLADSATGVALAFLGPKGAQKQDHNNAALYTVAVYGADGKPVRHARGGLASVYSGPFLYMMGGQADLDKLLALYEQEISAYPESKNDYWSARLFTYARQRKEGYQTTIRQGVDEYMAGKTAPTVADLMSAGQLYEMAGDKAKADSYRQQVIQKEPTGMMAQQMRAIPIRAEQDWTKKKELFAAFERDFADKPLFWSQMLAGDIAMGYIGHGDIDGLKQLVNQRPKYFEDSGVLNNIAWKMAEKGQGLPYAEELSKKSLTALNEQKQPENTFLPPGVTWEDNKKGQYRMYMDTYGYILEQQGKAAEAYAAYREAIDRKPEQSNPEVNERYVLSALKTGHPNEAKANGEAFVRAGKGTANIKEALRTLYARQAGADKNADAYIAGLEAAAKARHREEVMKALISEPAPAFALKDLKGNDVSLASLRGKIVVVDFWATWCGPCIASFPGMQRAQAKFQQNPNVKFLFVNTMEGRDEPATLTKKVADFVDKKQYDFTVPLDLDSKVSTSYKVTGIPTKFVIDQQGNVRYKSIGFSGSAEKTVDEISLVVDLLSAKDAGGKTN